MLNRLVTAGLSLFCFITTLNASAGQESNRCLRKVKFTVKNDYNVDLVTFKKMSGVGQDEITFGNHEPICTKTVEVEMVPGTSYTLESFKVNNKSCQSRVRKHGNDGLEFSDDYGETYKGLVITSEQVHFELGHVNGETHGLFSLDFDDSCECNTNDDCHHGHHWGSSSSHAWSSSYTWSSSYRWKNRKTSISVGSSYPWNKHHSSSQHVLCPGMDSDKYCDCDYHSDCTKKPSYCQCEEAQACCGNSHQKPVVESNQTCRTKVKFTVTNNYEKDVITFKKTSGYGPNFIKFGNQRSSCTETKEVAMSPGTKYELVMCQAKGHRCKCFDENNHHKTIVENGQLKFSDDGGNTYTGLVIESDKCFFNGDATNFELGSSYSCDFYSYSSSSGSSSSSLSSGYVTGDGGYYSSNNRKNIAGKNQK